MYHSILWWTALHALAILAAAPLARAEPPELLAELTALHATHPEPLRIAFLRPDDRKALAEMVAAMGEPTARLRLLEGAAEAQARRWVGTTRCGVLVNRLAPSPPRVTLFGTCIPRAAGFTELVATLGEHDGRVVAVGERAWGQAALAGTTSGQDARVRLRARAPADRPGRACTLVVTQVGEEALEAVAVGACGPTEPREPREPNPRRARALQDWAIVGLTLAPVGAGVAIFADGSAWDRRGEALIGLGVIVLGPAAGPLYGGAGAEVALPVLGRAASLAAVPLIAPDGVFNPSFGRAIVAGSAGMVASLAADIAIGLKNNHRRHPLVSVGPAGVTVSGRL